jgi:hypothetical protein
MHIVHLIQRRFGARANGALLMLGTLAVVGVGLGLLLLTR